MTDEIDPVGLRAKMLAAMLKRGGSLEDQHEAALLAALDPEDEGLVQEVATLVQAGRPGVRIENLRCYTRDVIRALAQEARG